MNQIDFSLIAEELGSLWGLSPISVERLSEELHNAYKVGKEGYICICPSCSNPSNNSPSK